MRAKTLGGALLAVWLTLAGGVAWGQGQGADPAWDIPSFSAQPSRLVARGQDPGAVGYAPSDPQIWLPLGSTRPEDGGVYLYCDYAMWHQTNPLGHQGVAIRGLIPSDNSVLPFAGQGQLIGSGQKALDVQQLNGPTNYQPGWEAGIGYKFKDGTTLTLNWFYLFDVKLSAFATLVPNGRSPTTPTGNPFPVFGDGFSNTFLTSPVTNFPSDFAGPPQKATVGSIFTFYGLWNGATLMSETFWQRFQQWDITYRMPVYDTECYRISGVMGPRFTWIWERYAWTTIDTDILGGSGAADVAIYSNVVSNRLWGAFIGCVQEWYWGHGFAGTLDTRAVAYIDSVKEIAMYQLGLHFVGPENKRARTEWRPAAELDARLGIKWYPTEFIECQLSYGAMGFFNTAASVVPIDFNYGRLTPSYNSVFRFFDGFNVGVAIVF
jgi:hypothetical protein